MTASTSLPAPSPSIHWPSVAQLVGGLLLLLNALILSVGAALAGALQVGPQGDGMALSSFTFVGTGVFLAAVGALNAIFAGLRLSGRPVQRNLPAGRLRMLGNPLLWLGLSLAALGLGYLVSAFDLLPWLLLPPLHVTAIILPVLLLTWLAVRGLAPGRPQRTWAVFTSGMLLGPPFIFLIELVALVITALMVLLVIAADPELQFSINRLAAYLQANPRPDFTRLQSMLQPLATQPVVLLALLANFALVVPLVEEFFKPIGVWLLFGRDLTPGQGFALGAISGAGYAVFETMGIQLGSEFWLAVVSIRAITGLLHVITAGLVGYGLVLAWREARYLRLAGLYLSSVLLHGLWNGMVILTSYATLQKEVFQLPPDQMLIPGYWQLAGAVGLGVLALGVFGLLLAHNRRLRMPLLAAQEDFVSQEFADQ